MSNRQNNIDFIIEYPKSGYFPHNNKEYYINNKKHHNKKHHNKKHAIGIWTTVDRRSGYWIFYNKGNNIIECGNYTDTGKKYGKWFGYFGGIKNLTDRLKYEINYFDDKIIGMQKFYLKTKNKKTVFLWKEIEYDEFGNLTGNMTKYNEFNNIICKTYICDNIIIKEKFDSNGNIIVHREYTLQGTPINNWIVNNCKPKRHSYIMIFLQEYYKFDFESKYKDDKSKNDDWTNYLNHPYQTLFSDNYKTIPECIYEINYIAIYMNEKKIIEIRDINNNIVCVVEKKGKERKKKRIFL